MTVAEDVLTANYARFPVTFVRGQGARLWDDEGTEYLDFLAGISVSNVGHCHPSVVAAITEQAARLIHVGNLYSTVPMVELAGRLARNSLGDGSKVFFANSGAEAVEAALVAGDKTVAADALKKAQPELARGVARGVIHKNTASRKYSRLTKRVSALG